MAKKTKRGRTKMTLVVSEGEGFEHGYALIIGVDDNNLQRYRLPVVSKDVQALHDVLIHPQRCGYLPENVRLLKGELATRENIFASLRWLQDKVADDNNATVIVYFSGFGTVDKKSGYSYLVPYDFTRIKEFRKNLSKTNLIRTESFISEINFIEARRLMVIIDSSEIGMALGRLFSFSGNEGILPSQQNSEIDDSHMLGKGTGKAILCSASGTNQSFIRRDGKMSIFTYHLIEALTGHATNSNNDNTILITDIMSWVAREVPKTAEIDGRVQIPSMGTTGVFPIASSYGEKNQPLDPLEALSPEFQAFVKDYIDERLQKNPPVTNIYHGDHITATVTDSQGVGIGRESKAENSRKQQISRDTYIMSGDFRGAMLNIKSSLKNARQTIESMSLSVDSDRQLMQNLINELEEALAKVPATHSDDAEAVSHTAEVLVNIAAEKNPNKTMLQISSEGLKQAANNLTEIVPNVPTVATGIVDAVTRVAAVS
jgi:hypothetical protein